jgi:hypothetical protein
LGSSRNPGKADNATPVGAGLSGRRIVAMDSSAVRLSSFHALSLTTIASKPAPTVPRDSVKNQKKGLLRSPTGASSLATDIAFAPSSTAYPPTRRKPVPAVCPLLPAARTFTCHPARNSVRGLASSVLWYTIRRTDTQNLYGAAHEFRNPQDRQLCRRNLY